VNSHSSVFIIALQTRRAVTSYFILSVVTLRGPSQTTITSRRSADYEHGAAAAFCVRRRLLGRFTLIVSAQLTAVGRRMRGPSSSGHHATIGLAEQLPYEISRCRLYRPTVRCTIHGRLLPARRLYPL